MWSVNNIFDFYQTAYNRSINNETMSKRNISSYDIVILIFLSLICLMIVICIIQVFVRRFRSRNKQNDLHVNNQSISKINQDETNTIDTLSVTDSIQ
jgi:flagellar biosynthesis/type III secretory pathway M-ring protein FliF/YscJ